LFVSLCFLRLPAPIATSTLSLHDALPILLLAQHVLRAQALLLLQAHGVVGLGPTTGAAVLARGVRALLEVLGGLRGQGEPEGSGQTRLTARTGDVGHEVYLLSHVVNPVMQPRIQRPPVSQVRSGLNGIAPWRAPRRCGVAHAGPSGGPVRRSHRTSSLRARCGAATPGVGPRRPPRRGAAAG